MKKQKSNIIYRMMILTIIGGLLLVASFYMVQTAQIRSRSVASLQNFLVSEESESPEQEPGIDYFAKEDIEDHTAIEVEELIWNYYQNNASQVNFNEVYAISQKNLKAYFSVLQPSGDSPTLGEQEVLFLYTDVSFTMSIVRNSIWAMLLILAILSLLLYGMNRYLIRTLEEKDRAMRSFFENASHELKTPLMSIGGYVDGIKTGVTDAEESYGVIDREIARMSKLISNILDLSKIDGGMVTLQKSETDLREIIYDCLTAIEPLAVENQIELSVKMEKPIFRLCDEQMITSAFSNIFTNAIRYAKSEISVSMEDNRIIITNDGEVPREQDLEHIFDRFYKGQNGQNGIGMALTKEYLTLHDMEITAGIVQNQLQFQIRLTNEI